MVIDMMKLLATFLLVFGIAESRDAVAGYQDAVELQRKCESTGQFAASVFRNKKRFPNFFDALNKAPKKDRVYLDPKSTQGKGELGHVMRDIYSAVYFDGSIGTSKDAYMYGWSICMDRKFEE